jgi:hypothetical protein
MTSRLQEQLLNSVLASTLSLPAETAPEPNAHPHSRKQPLSLQVTTANFKRSAACR